MTSTGQTPTSGRLEFIDALRGFAIVLVVLGHSLQGALAAPDGNALYRLIYAFHMPLFMAISGFVYSGDKRVIGSEFRLKTRALLLPFLAWLPVTFAWMQSQPAAPSAQAFVRQVIASPDNGGLWFLWVLFLINLLVLAGRKLAPSRPLAAAAAIWLVLNGVALARPASDLLGIKLLCWHFPFFVAGLLLRRYGAFRWLRPGIAIACGVLFLLLFQDWTRTGGGAALQAAGGPRGALGLIMLRGYNYATASLAILALFGLFAMPALSTATSVFRGFGRISLEIYASHIYFVSLAVSASAAIGLPDAVRVAAVFSVGLAGGLLADLAIKRWRPLAWLMFGSRARENAHPVATENRGTR